MDSSTAYVALGVAAVVVIIMLAWFRQWHTRRRRIRTRQLGGSQLEGSIIERLHATNGIGNQPMFPPRIYVAMPVGSVQEELNKPEDLPPYRPRVNQPPGAASDPPPYTANGTPAVVSS
ncbi:hypothetical protein LPJ59_005283 [Coemansia sp. RSA 2399]|nr:hypothetical protein LPJ59_005283 [Coemansia sp. RSA 2399]